MGTKFKILIKRNHLKSGADLGFLEVEWGGGWCGAADFQKTFVDLFLGRPN